MYLFSDRFILTILNACICIFGDTLVQWNDESQLIKALFDNITHATIGCISAVIIISETDNQTVGIEKIALIGLSVIVSSLIDVDHFIVAKSIKLAKAISIDRRPFFHFTLIPVLMMILMYPMHYIFYSTKTNLWLTMIICAFLTHHMRDSTRRGFSFWPFGTTKPLPYFLYVAFIMALPFILVKWHSFTTNSIQHRHQPLQTMTV